MARDDDGALVRAPSLAPAPASAPAPATAPAYQPAWRRTCDRFVKMLRKAGEQVEELLVERELHIAQIQFLQSELHEREEISQARIQQICKHAEIDKRVLEADTAVSLGGKELAMHCYQKLAEIAEGDLEDLKSCILDLTAENSELKEKLNESESQVEVSTGNPDRQKSGKEEIRKLKEAYKILRSEKDKQTDALQAENRFVWNQLEKMEEDYRGTIKSKNVELKQATEAAQKLLVAAQEKDDEIAKLQKEVTNANGRISVLQDELRKLRSLVKDKDREPEVTPNVSRTFQATPDRSEMKSRTHTSETNQKRKRSFSKSSLSFGNQRCSARPLKVKDSSRMSLILLPPNFTVPRLKTPNPSSFRKG